MPNLSEEQWRSFSDYLDRALELPESERTPWLAELASTHPEIAAEIERALAVRDRKGYAEFLSDSPFPSAPTPARPSSDAASVPTSSNPRSVGAAWAASGERAEPTDDSRVRSRSSSSMPTGSAETGEERFRSEGRMLGRLDHPNIARLIDAGVIDDSQPYLVLEYVEGEPIDAYCDRLELGVEARVALFQGVLAAVGHAHSHLIIHRDLKPANVFVTREGTVKLLDFGIAKLLTQDGDTPPSRKPALRR